MAYSAGVILLICLAGLFYGNANETNSEILDRMIEETGNTDGLSSADGNASSPQLLSTNTVLVHGLNDTNATSVSNLNISAGFTNVIKNYGGFQKIVANNNIQYNFYFWVVPDNFNKTFNTQPQN